MVYLIYLSQNNARIQKSSDYATLNDGQNKARIIGGYFKLRLKGWEYKFLSCELAIGKQTTGDFKTSAIRNDIACGYALHTYHLLCMLYMLCIIYA